MELLNQQEAKEQMLRILKADVNTSKICIIVSCVDNALITSENNIAILDRAKMEHLRNWNDGTEIDYNDNGNMVSIKTKLNLLDANK